MGKRMNRKFFQLFTHEELDTHDKDYWKTASIKEKFETMTYLRECFYGPEATTGRLQSSYGE
jgi:hypothetical protein